MSLTIGYNASADPMLILIARLNKEIVLLKSMVYDTKEMSDLRDAAIKALQRAKGLAIELKSVTGYKTEELVLDSKN